ncbi:hypothetical protein [Sphingomonas sanxanigenens]|uniref:DnaT DNA-binding domain-containing protein n=1 Tax=Sphingomonas sanxanigenens DSM 19645 = NX02 TaxID=1123269 RepID=W0A5P7_9SPHN|nr:hypothetical protein [Sphingomonas sanxanigenens]AHE52381.1 hypothetical protein NX02_03130 [Sphingomonas sanxanigenens DSM 19645 = NX02]
MSRGGGDDAGALVAALVDAGLAPALLARVARLLGRLDAADAALAAAAIDPVAERRRAYDRERKSAGAGGGRSTGIPADRAAPPPDKETPPTPPKEINPLIDPAGGAPRARRRTTASRLPPDWQPAPLTPGTIAHATVNAWEPGRIERELARFRDHYAAAPGERGLAADWQARWRTWIGNAEQWEQHRNDNRTRHRPPRERPLHRSSAGSAAAAGDDPAFNNPLLGAVLAAAAGRSAGGG